MRCLELDLTVDGADEIGPDLCLIKGGGGALLAGENRRRSLDAHDCDRRSKQDGSKYSGAFRYLLKWFHLAWRRPCGRSKRRSDQFSASVR